MKKKGLKIAIKTHNVFSFNNEVDWFPGEERGKETKHHQLTLHDASFVP